MCLPALVLFLFSMGESIWLFSSICVHLYIFILVEFFNWHFGSIFVNIKFRSLPKWKQYNGQHGEGAYDCKEEKATFHCNNTGFIHAFDTVIMKSFTELWRAPPKNQNMLTGGSILYLGSLCELGEEQGRGECRYQSLVLLHCVSHMYVCISSVESQPAKLRNRATTQH